LNSHLPSWLLMLAVPLEEGDLGSWSGDLGPEIFVLYGKKTTKTVQKASGVVRVLTVSKF
jgi:hypothetical protein